MLLQFPFYAGIFGIITGTGVSDAMAVFFVRTSTPAAFPALVFAYSTTLGMFVPSGGANFASRRWAWRWLQAPRYSAS